MRFFESKWPRERRPRITAVRLLVCALLPLLFGAASPAPRFDRVLFVVADALRSDHLGVSGYERDTSPNIDRLATEGVLFPNLLVQSSHTVPSVAALLTGSYPSDLGIEFWPETKGFSPEAEKAPPRLPVDATTLAEQLSQAGFHTAAVVANPWLKEEYGFAQGYDEYVVSVPGERPLRANGASINEKAFAILAEKRERPLFLYLHYLDTHNPYDRKHVPRRYRPDRGRVRYRNGLMPGLSKADLRYTEASYDEGIRYFDGLLGELRDFLAKNDLLERTLIVLVSDHGDEFHEHGGLGHGQTLHNEVVRGFAIFWSPQLKPARGEAPVQGVDVSPTVLRLVGRETTAEGAGRALLDERGRIVESEPRARFTELGPTKAVIAEGWKLTVGADGEERFHYVGEDLAVERPEKNPPEEVAAALRERLARRIDPKAAASPRPAAGEIDESTAEALRALGYLEP